MTTVADLVKDFHGDGGVHVTLLRKGISAMDAYPRRSFSFIYLDYTYSIQLLEAVRCGPLPCDPARVGGGGAAQLGMGQRGCVSAEWYAYAFTLSYTVRGHGGTGAVQELVQAQGGRRDGGQRLSQRGRAGGAERGQRAHCGAGEENQVRSQRQTKRISVSSRASPHRPREERLAHPADTSRANLAAALGSAFQTPAGGVPAPPCIYI
jgi:hypothetical protein